MGSPSADAVGSRNQAAHRFGDEVVKPKLRHHEDVLSAGEMRTVMEEARSVGLLPTGPNDEGLWRESKGSLDFTVDALRALAAINGGVAFGLHRAALANRLQARLGFTGTSSETAVSLQGHYGLGRSALPRLLGGHPLDDADSDLLRDYFDLAAHARVVIGGPWESLIAATFENGQIAWQVLNREQCIVEPRPDSHGFDELEITTVQRDGGAASVTDTAAFTEILYLDHLGMTAIATGLVEHSIALAREYARERRQGGRMIDAFPAVAQMLGQMSGAARAGAQHLAWFANKPPTAENLADLCAVRGSFHRECCTATNNGMQVLGGRGYMQDHGLERLVRDCNVLRVIGGTPVELALFAAEWERAQ